MNGEYNGMTVSEYCDEYRKGNISGGQVRTCWFDWYCSDYDLKSHTGKVWEVLDKIKNERLLTGYMLSLLNSAPVRGPFFTYDIICMRPEGMRTFDRDIYVRIGDRRRKHRYELLSGGGNPKLRYEGDSAEEICGYINTHDPGELAR